MKKIQVLFYKTWPIFVIAAFCIWAIKPLFVPGFFTMHDDEQIARLFEMSKVIHQGQIPPRWVPDLGFGFGYPLFNFYPPFVYYLGTIFYSLGFSLITSTKIVMGCGFFLSGVFMYLWTKNRFGVLAGLFSALLYLYAPYHAVDIYVRGALSEFFSFVWIPAIFWTIDLLAKKPTKKHLIFVSIFLCFVVLTHTLVMLQFIPFLLCYGLFLLWEEGKRIKILLPYFLMSAVLGLGLAAYFAIPSVVEKQYTLVDSILTREFANYSIHFVCPTQFWNSLWGYGGSVAGCLDGLSFQIGKIHILVALLSLVLGLWGLIRKKYKSSVGFLAFCLFLFSLFMATEYSKGIWDILQPLWYIQFPWRYLLFSAVFSSFLGGYCIRYLQKLIGVKGALLTFVVLGMLGLYLVRNDFQPQTYLPVGDNYYIQNQDIQWRVSGLSYEYVPKEVATRLSALRTTELAIDKSDIPASPFSVLSGNMDIQITQNLANKKSIVINVRNPGILQVNTYAFPGWQLTVDGKKVSYFANNPLHLIQLSLSKHKHTVEATFTDTRIRTISNVISLISLLILLILFLPRRSRSV